MDEDNKGQRKMEDSGGGLLSTVDTVYNRIEWNGWIPPSPARYTPTIDMLS